MFLTVLLEYTNCRNITNSWLSTETGLHLGGGARGAFAPPKNKMAPLGYVVCIVTYTILKRFMNHMMSHHSYLIKIKFLH